jgi:glycosidase
VDFMSQGWGARRKAFHSLLRNDAERTALIGLSGHSFFDRKGKGDIMDFLIPYMEQYKAIKGKGYISLYSGNHDLSRVSIGRNHRDLEVVFAFLLTMPGTPFIYYGDEIGMKYLNLTSKEGGYARTGARTPMQWTTGKNAGFSKADKDKLYLPIDPSQNRPSVEEQEKLPNSLLNKVRAFSLLRHRYPVLGADADFVPLYAKAGKYPFVYMRKAGKERMLIAINPAARKVKASFRLKGFDCAKLLAGRGTTIKSGKGICEISMDGVSYGIFHEYRI